MNHSARSLLFLVAVQAAHIQSSTTPPPAVSSNTDTSVDDYGVWRTDDEQYTPVRTAPHYHHLAIEDLMWVDLSAVSTIESIVLNFKNGDEFYGLVTGIVRKGRKGESQQESTGPAMTVYFGGFILELYINGLVLYGANGGQVLHQARFTTFKVPASPNRTNTNTDTTTTSSSSSHNLRQRALQGGAFFGPGSAFDGAFGGPISAVDSDRRLDDCPAGGCGTARIGRGLNRRRAQNCQWQTGVEGGYDPCNSPAVSTANLFDPTRDQMLGIDPVSCNDFMTFGCNFEQRNGWA
ncbi:unnamed protein product [Vitrella brassicaformis CCMP3155]|uniref:Uncharacterized protein n=2 Tax=Vitrella brassicaformis TaxID=1169539 RepID=A0A0G4G3Z7_VITBC|nr:unnamed protein product [Vitrella brassicaformis CCMP3155]|mmetsp:Transcript_24420/g.60282  ORF Transcript_24420/g.60282 Transcript_24420/m.60282 type:complete len:293 (+) Transcript_24420:148-1026(+)|eukprot:CEM22932.1 unnamed protein product [Vitrella brassicaformis CCMP3155]